MPLISILTEKKINEYEQPPVFSAQERKYFLTMPASIKLKVNSFHTITNKVGFQLMFGYFLARRRFYPPEQFQENDIRFLCRRLGVLPFAFDAKSYRKSTYTRHRTIILEYFAFKAYQPSFHDELLSNTIEAQIYSWEDNALIFNFMLEWLEWRRIELPTYHNLQIIITRAIRDRNKKIKHKFGQLLEQHHKDQLDKLMVKNTTSGKEEYLLTTLQTLSPSDAPKQIRANLKKLQLIQTVFESSRPLMERMNFSDNAIRYFGEYVSLSKSSNVNRREGVDKYLHLATFCAYQRSIFEDWMACTLLMVCKTSINKASKKEKDRLFQGRKQRRRAFQQVIHIAAPGANQSVGSIR